jgi:tripartite ATP-independent transporter DctP family solute receptor
MQAGNGKIERSGVARRGVLLGGAALPFLGIGSRFARAAEFTFKMASGQPPTSPITIRLNEAANRVREATNGRVEIRFFPNGQLGTDTDLISQARAGGIDLLNITTANLSSLVPLCGILNTGFAFKDYAQVWSATDGELGSLIRSHIEKIGLFPVARPGDNEFHNITTSTKQIKTPDDLKGLRLRVPPAPIFTALFKALGAEATTINFNELYTALQTHVVEGEENGLVVLETVKFYEVQKYCFETKHIWDGFWVVMNRRSLQRLPTDLQEIVKREFDRAMLDQRADVVKLVDSLRKDLTTKGLQFVPVDRGPFREALKKTSFYQDWKTKFGLDAWAKLESVAGVLA